MSQTLAHIAGMVLNQPLLLEPSYAQTFFSALAPRLNINTLQNLNGEQLDSTKMQQQAAGYESRRTNRSFQLIDGVAVIPVSGTLVHKFGHLQPHSGMTGYDGILARVMQAAGDPDVKGILLDQDSPGGSVAGCFDTVTALQKIEAQSGKPIWSLCYDMTCSASMALACGASKRLITQNGRAGSVGVIMAHASYEKHLEKEGINVTLITSGERKADGNPYENLPKDVLETFQNDTDALRQDFALLVSEATGLTIQQVLKTEAQTYRGQTAIDIGFADELINGHEAVAYFADFLNQELKTQHNTKSNLIMTETAATPNQATLHEPRKEADATAIIQQAKTDERARIQTIMQCEHAKGREALAEYFAFDTDMSAEAAAAALAKAPAQLSAQHTIELNPLDAAMQREAQPNIGADTTASQEEPDIVAMAIGAYNEATGAKLGK